MTSSAKFIIRAITIAIVASTISPFGFVKPVMAQRDTTAENNYFSQKQYYQPISDANFLAHSSMTVAQIEEFLRGQGSPLATNSPQYSSLNFGEEAGGRSPAQIIWDAAQANYDSASGTVSGICIDNRPGSPANCVKSTVSPRVILITLQKEQSLITGSFSTEVLQARLDKAMGYGCPDSGSCDKTKAGFARQVGWGAWQLRLNYERSERGVPDNGVFYKDEIATLGDGRPENSGTFHPVLITNSATAALYRYTPWIFFGNYNFWRMGVQWFGFTTDFSTVSGANDTSPASFGTYSNKLTVRGLKRSNVQVFYGSHLVKGFGATDWEANIPLVLGQHIYTVVYRDADGNDIDSKAITIERRPTGDINGDGTVDLRDLSILSESFGTNVTDGDWRKLSSDGSNEVNLTDLSVFGNAWK